MQLKKMLIIKGVNDFPIYFILCVLSVILLFIIFNLSSFLAYGITEKSLFFGHQFDISSSMGSSELPQIAVEGNYVYVVWQDNTPGNYDVLFTYSSDNGNSFAPVRNLSNNNGTSELPQIAVEGNYVYVVWQDNTPGNYDVLFTYSSDNGNSFAPVRNLSNNNGTSELPQIAVEGNYVYVVWQDNTPGNYEIFLKLSLSNATKFKERNISRNNGTSQFPQVAAEGNNVYIVWHDNTPGNYDILFKRSSNNGEGFKSVNLRNTNGTSQLPQIAVQNDTVYVVWQDNTPGNYEIFLQKALSNGTKYRYRDLSNNNGTSDQPQLSVSGDKIYVIWRDDDDKGLHKIFFKHIQKDNATGKIEYGSTYRLNHTGEPAQAKLITGLEDSYGVWSTYLNNKNVSTLEFYPFTLLGDNSGESIPLTRLDSNQSASNPDIASSNGDTFLVWENNEVGNKDIFFKKLSTNFFERNE